MPFFRLPVLIACTAVALLAQNSTTQKHLMVAAQTGIRPVTLSARNIERGPHYPSVVHLSGAVEIKTPVCIPAGRNNSMVCDGEMVVRADQADFHEDTGRIEAHGNVSVTPIRHK
jgi:lipopolysaccharide assembly outer membrane protein LptD (OstA)